jgi:hypothetical protein
MNVRRGLLLAGIHLAVAVPLVIWQEARDWPNLRAEWEPAQGPVLRMAAWQEEEAFGFNPCNFWESIPATTTVLVIGELPAAIVVGIGEECPARWTVAGSLRAALHTPPYRSNRAAEVGIAASFCVLIALQWVLLGGFPLVHPRRWWLEPGALITACSVVSGALLLVAGALSLAQNDFLVGAAEVFLGFARLPAFVSFFCWLWWFGLLFWKSLRAGWRLAARRLAHSH